MTVTATTFNDTYVLYKSSADEKLHIFILCYCWTQLSHLVTCHCHRGQDEQGELYLTRTSHKPHICCSDLPRWGCSTPEIWFILLLLTKFLGACTSCRFWPQVAFAWIVAWLARLNTDGKRPVDELNLKSLAGLTRRLKQNISYHRPGQKPGWPGEGLLPWRPRAGRFSTGGIRIPVTQEPVSLTRWKRSPLGQGAQVGRWGGPTYELEAWTRTRYLNVVSSQWFTWIQTKWH